MRRYLPMALLTLAAACSSSNPAAPDDGRPLNDAISVFSSIAPGSSSASGLQIGIALHNVSQRAASVVLSHDLPVAVRLLADTNPTPVLVAPSVWGVTRLPMVVELARNRTRSFDRTVPPAALAALPAGTYRVQVAVNASPNALIMDVGTVALPLR